ncbi:KH domain-containing protein [Bdellovibrio sp. NC01]|nr:KH domain-containing protein [Bdellovibrio sp. NC01]
MTSPFFRPHHVCMHKTTTAAEQENARESAKKFLYNVLTEILPHPEDITINYSIGPQTTIYKVTCNKKALGQLIGAKGKMITCIRTLLAAKMARTGVRAIIEIPYSPLKAWDDFD